MQEAELATMKDERLCPVRFAMPGGWFLIMPRCDPVKMEELDHQAFYGLPLDFKASNFGRYQGRIVMVDYGS
jgi:hypothetical protein